MFTRCPDCRTVYHITAAELRAAEGTVICGACSATFDALESLSEARPRDAAGLAALAGLGAATTPDAQAARPDDATGMAPEQQPEHQPEHHHPETPPEHRPDHPPERQPETQAENGRDGAPEPGDDGENGGEDDGFLPEIAVDPFEDAIEAGARDEDEFLEELESLIGGGEPLEVESFGRELFELDPELPPRERQEAPRREDESAADVLPEDDAAGLVDDPSADLLPEDIFPMAPRDDEPPAAAAENEAAFSALDGDGDELDGFLDPDSVFRVDDMPDGFEDDPLSPFVGDDEGAPQPTDEGLTRPTEDAGESHPTGTPLAATGRDERAGTDERADTDGLDADESTDTNATTGTVEALRSDEFEEFDQFAELDELDDLDAYDTAEPTVGRDETTPPHPNTDVADVALLTAAGPADDSPARRGADVATPSLDIASTDPDVPEEFAPAQKPRRRWLKVSLALLGVLVLTGAWAHLQHGKLLRHPAGQAVLAPIYAALGIPATPEWNPAEFRALRWEAIAATDQPDVLVVAVDFMNAASYPQPYPVIRVILEGRDGRRVGTHDVMPAQYLEGYANGRRLNANGRVQATVTVPDPGGRADGFRLDFCLDLPARGLVCGPAPFR